MAGYFIVYSFVNGDGQLRMDNAISDGTKHPMEIIYGWREADADLNLDYQYRLINWRAISSEEVEKYKECYE